MKILSISNSDIWPWGENKGIPSIFASQKGFVDNGHEVYFLCPAKQGKPKVSDYQGIHICRFSFPFNIDVLSLYSIRLDKFTSRVLSSIFSNLEWFSFQFYSFFWVLKKGFEVKPDIIYSHGLHPAFPAWAASRILRTKLVFRVYGTRDLYWLSMSCLGRLKEFRDLLALKLPVDYLIITKDGTRAEDLAMKLGVSAQRIRCWRNGVDFNMCDFSPDIKSKVRSSLGIDPSAKIIISTCRLIPFYRVDRLVHSLDALFNEHSGSVCVIAGDGPDRKSLEEYVSGKGIQNRVFFSGIVSKERLKELLNAADIYVSLSDYSNCNNSMWEAMVCGKCVVTMSDETTCEVIVNGKSGVLINKDELNKLHEVLKSLLENDAYRKTLSEQARFTSAKVLETWPARISREVELLSELVK